MSGSILASGEVAGVRSRRAAAAIASLGLELGDTLHAVRQALQQDNIADSIRDHTDEATSIWLNAITINPRTSESTKARSFAPFGLDNADTNIRLYVRSNGDDVYLSSVDGRFTYAVSDTADMPFSAIANDPRYCFVYSDYERAWHLFLQDPRLAQWT